MVTYNENSNDLEIPTIRANLQLKDIEISNQSSLTDLDIKLVLYWERSTWIYDFNTKIRMKDWFDANPPPVNKKKSGIWADQKTKAYKSLASFNCTFYRASEIQTMLEKIWYPEVYAKNIGSNIDIRKYNELTITYKREDPDKPVDPDLNYNFLLSSNIDLEVKNKENFKSFPFDKINVEGGLSFRNVKLTVDEIDQDSHRSVIKEVIKQWKVTDLNIEPKSKSQTNEHELIYNLELKRNSNYYIWKIILPIFVIVLISLGNFWIKSKDIEAKLNLTVGSLLSLIAYNFVFGDDIPKLNYLTVLDYIILTSYFFAFLSTIVTLILSFRFNKQGEANGEYHKWDKPFGIFLPIAYTVIMIGWLFPVYFIN
ncbi:hypothetical protein N9852_04745 [Alphaproteobacteria bacterium]|nr:hypothetical protein [Alphaproteobacteria bacterium]